MSGIKCLNGVNHGFSPVAAAYQRTSFGLAADVAINILAVCPTICISKALPWKASRFASQPLQERG
jgi:hypothetical protein